MRLTQFNILSKTGVSFDPNSKSSPINIEKKAKDSAQSLVQNTSPKMETFESGQVDLKYIGKGKIVYKDKTYEGDLVEGKQHGKGILAYKDGGIYEGDFVNDKFEGKGKMIYKDGKIYEGDWANHKKHGNGLFTMTSGGYYKGVFKNEVYLGAEDDEEMYIRSGGIPVI